MNHIGENVVRIEAEALRALADRIAGPMAQAFNRAVEMIYGCAGRVVVTGMGKSGIVARKIAATLSSTGTPALFMHPVEAVHGDLGMVVRGDVVLALSALAAPAAFGRGGYVIKQRDASGASVLTLAPSGLRFDVLAPRRRVAVRDGRRHREQEHPGQEPFHSVPIVNPKAPVRNLLPDPGSKESGVLR